VTAHRGPAINCVCCGRAGRHAARGLVDACYARHKVNGTLDQFQRRYQRVEDTREEHEFLTGQGLDDDEVAKRLGIKRSQLGYALKVGAR
jgi:hypothetical protein